MAFHKTNNRCHFIKLCWNLNIARSKREYVWLKSIVQHIIGTCELSLIQSPTWFKVQQYCIKITMLDAQRKGDYIKGDRIKHISQNFFFMHELEKSKDVDVQQIWSCDNLANLITKALPSSTFHKFVHKIGMHRLSDLWRRIIFVVLRGD